MLKICPINLIVSCTAILLMVRSFNNRMPFGGVTVKDVEAHEFVKAFAAHLKK